MSERALASAVILRAFDDATGRDQRESTLINTSEAWSFLTDTFGEWAASRAFWADAAGSHPDDVRRRALACECEHRAWLEKLRAREKARAAAQQIARDVASSRRAAIREAQTGHKRVRVKGEARARYQARREEERRMRVETYSHISVRLVTARIEAGMPGPNLSEIAQHLALSGVSQASWWMKRVAATGAIAWEGKKRIVWKLPDGRRSLPSITRDKQRRG